MTELRLLPGQLLGDELLQVPGDLLRGGGHHLWQDDLLRDRQVLAHQRRDDLLNRDLLPEGLLPEGLLAGELLAGELLLARVRGLHGELLREAAVLLREAAVLLRLAEGLLRLAEGLLDAERGREARHIALLCGHALDGGTLGGDWGGHKRPPNVDVDYCPVILEFSSDKIGH